MANMSSAPQPRRNLAPVQTIALVMGIVFLLVGIARFIPGVTTNYDSMSFATHHSEAMLLGVFQVSILHNIVHLLFGIVGLVAARTFAAARYFLIIGGIVYLALLIYGLIVPMDSAANFVPVNAADNWLHLVLGVVMTGAGIVAGRRPGTTTPST